jgi:hypothetical protein
MIRKTYRYRLYPTKQQAILLAKHFGCCRFIYNWALEQRIKHYQETGKTIHKFEIMKRLVGLKKENLEKVKKKLNECGDCYCLINRTNKYIFYGIVDNLDEMNSYTDNLIDFLDGGNERLGKVENEVREDISVINNL